MKFPLISILIPVYNVEKYLDRCMKSVLEQTYPNIEIILMDDGSRDNSGRIARKWSEISREVYYYSQEHAGLSVARNNLLRVSKGDIICFLDSDDYLDKKAIEVMYHIMKDTETKAVQCAMEKTSEDRVKDLCINDEIVKSSVMVFSDPIIDFQSTLTPLRTMVIGKLFRKSLFDNIVFPIGKIHEDEAVMHKLMGKTDRVAYTSLKLYRYYKNPESITRKPFTMERFDIIDAITDRVEYMEKRGYRLLADLNRVRVCMEVMSQTKEALTWFPDMNIMDSCLQEKKNICEHYYSDLKKHGFGDEELIEQIRKWIENPVMGISLSYWDYMEKVGRTWL